MVSYQLRSLKKYNKKAPWHNTGELNKIIQIVFLCFLNLDNTLSTLLQTYHSISVAEDPDSFLRILSPQTYSKNPF